MQEKVVLIYSGGMDSFTLLHDLVRQGYSVHALSVNYGQRHRRELQKARDVCGTHIPHLILQLPQVTGLSANSALAGHTPLEVPEGHYDEETMRATVVPGRNLLLLTLAYMHATAVGANAVYYAAHAGDHHIYPDCRPKFIHRVDGIFECMEDDFAKRIELRAPYQDLNKGQILSIGLDLGLDYSWTWTCYKGGDVPCGRCGACVERKHAFAANKAIDPLGYQDAQFMKIPEITG